MNCLPKEMREGNNTQTFCVRKQPSPVFGENISQPKKFWSTYCVPCIVLGTEDIWNEQDILYIPLFVHIFLLFYTSLYCFFLITKTKLITEKSENYTSKKEHKEY